jgi:hypothetical protein
VKNKDTSAIFAKKVSDKLDTPLLLHSGVEKFVPFEGDYVLLIDGKSDGSVYHHTSVAEFVNCGHVLKPNSEFKRMTELTVEEMSFFLRHRKI